MLPETFIGYGI